MKKLFGKKSLSEKIKDGRKQIAEGKGITTAEAKKKLKKWLK